MTPEQQKEFDTCWDSLGTNAPKGTAIYNAWIAAWARGSVYGPPKTLEYSTNKSDGTPIKAQEFNVRAEHNPATQETAWYGFSGRVG